MTRFGKTVVTGTALLGALVGKAAQAQALDRTETPHEAAPTAPWVRYPAREQLRTGHCGGWERDGFKSIQVNIDERGCNITGDAANEPSIAVSPVSPRKIVIGWRQFDSVDSDFRQAGWGYSHDGGHTWVAPGSVYPGVFGSDPVLAVDTDGVLYFLSIDFKEMRLFKSHDGGVSWGQPVQVVDHLYDKPWMTIDHSESLARNAIYICAPTQPLLRSLDRGQTFEEVSVDARGMTLATNINGDLLLADGISLLNFTKSIDIKDPAIPSPTFENMELRVGLNALRQNHPNGVGLFSQAWVATDHSTASSMGNIYLLTVAILDPRTEAGDPADIVFIRSTDGGSTWSRPIAINDDAPSFNSWQWFNTMSIAPNGRIDVVWNDTRNSQQRDLCELYYSRSNDGGKTWSANVAVSPMFDSRIGRPAANSKIGDYYHMISDNLGANVAYAATFNGEQDIYFLRIGPWDCNGNEIDDAQDIAGATSLDCNANEVPDECEYRADLDGDALTTLTDYAAFASSMNGPAAAVRGSEHPLTSVRGSDDPPASPLCKGGGAALLDIDHDGDIDLADFYGLQRVFAGP